MATSDPERLSYSIQSKNRVTKKDGLCTTLPLVMSFARFSLWSSALDPIFTNLGSHPLPPKRYFDGFKT